MDGRKLLLSSIVCGLCYIPAALRASVLTGTILCDNATASKADDVPASEALITVLRGTTIVANTVTDDDGNYSITGLPEGTYTIGVAHDGHELTEKYDVNVGGDPGAEVNFLLKQTAITED